MSCVLGFLFVMVLFSNVVFLILFIPNVCCADFTIGFMVGVADGNSFVVVRGGGYEGWGFDPNVTVFL